MDRSTLVKPRKRQCPTCGHLGFALTGKDFYGNPSFECNQCKSEWTSECGPRKGTSLHRIADVCTEDE